MTDISSLRGAGAAAASPFTAATDTLLAQLSSKNENAKIDKSGKDFEAILLGNWLQSAEQSFTKVPGTDEDDSDDDQSSGGAQFMDMAMQQLGSTLAAGGGIGIGKMISNQLHKSEDTQPKSASSTAS